MSDTTGIVVFDFARFIARYPEFATLDPALAGLFFNEAAMFLNNTPTSPVTDTAMREMMLFMLTAHIALIEQRARASGGALVGPITSASEGSVSVSTSMQIASPTVAWYMQTPYGAAYYTATQAYRMARWIPGRLPYLGVRPYGPGWGPFW